MKRQIAAVLAAAMLLSASTGWSAGPDKEFEKKLRETLKANPSILIDALQDSSEDLLRLVEQAVENRRKVEVREMQLKELKNPLKPELDADRLLLGPENAPLTIVEFSDFQCPFCSKTSKALDKALEKLKAQGLQARVYFRNHPLRQHKSALLAAAFFEAARLQGQEVGLKFYRLLFENQTKLDELGQAGMRDLAVKAGADATKLEADLRNPVVQKRLDGDINEYRNLNFGDSGVPVIVINGVSLRGVATTEDILDLVEMVRSGKAKPAAKGEPREETKDAKDGQE